MADVTTHKSNVYASIGLDVILISNRKPEER